MSIHATRRSSMSVCLRLCIAGAVLAANAPASGQCDSIADPIVCEAVRNELGIAPGVPITDDDLLALTWLRMIGDSSGQTVITSFEGLDKAENLSFLYVEGFRLRDFSTITTMTGLRTLTLSTTDIDSIVPFTQMVWLDSLALSHSDFSDLSGLENMTQLADLVLKGNGIDDISPLGSLTNLTRLSLRDNSLGSSDCTPLQDLTDLRILSLMANDITYIDFLADLNGLEELTLQDNRISDISPLASLTNLSYLNLEGNDLNDQAYDVYLPLIQANNPGAWIYFDPIPEPGAAGLLLLGAMGAFRRRQSNPGDTESRGESRGHRRIAAHASRRVMRDLEAFS